LALFRQNAKAYPKHTGCAINQNFYILGPLKEPETPFSIAWRKNLLKKYNANIEKYARDFLMSGQQWA
jgi:hypothetical protein